MQENQNYKNHQRVVPVYHIGVFFPFFANFLWAAYRLARAVSTDTVIGFFMATAFVLMFFAVRRMVLTVQDRVIRLEMRLRLREALPPGLHADIQRLSVDQLVALRFASDSELPELTRDVLAGKYRNRREIKIKIRDWQGDYLRA